MKSKNELIQNLKEYSTNYEEEEKFISQFLDLLKFKHCFNRDHLPGHITGSAWIIDESKSFALLVHHAKLNKWLQPGGHADGDENILRVAQREAIEETGVNVNLFKDGIFDIDIHPIPGRNDFPEHLHYDIRFAFTASKEEQIQKSDESHEVQWIKLSQVPQLTLNNKSIERMVEKIISS